MARRGYRALPVGGEYRSGDPAKIPEGKVARAENVFLRPGRFELRDGWKSDPLQLFQSLGKLTATAGERLFGITVNGDFYTHSDALGTWALVGAGPSYVTFGDYANFNDVAYNTYLTGTLANEYYTTVSWDGATFNAAACQPNLAGGTVCSFQRRVFMGNITERIVNELAPDEVHGMETTWTSSLIGEFYAVGLASNYQRMEYAGTGTSRYFYRDVFVMPATGYLRWTQTLISRDFLDIPLTLTVEDSTGKVYSTLEVTLDRYFVSGGTDIQRVSLEALIPSGKTVRLKITTGNQQIPHPSGVAPTAWFQFYVASNGGLAGGDIPPDVGFFGPQVTLGRYPFPYGQVQAWDGIEVAWPARVINRYPYRVAWSETDDPTWWRGINYYDIKEVPGKITALRQLAGRLTAHKGDGITVLRSTPDADNPVQFEEHHEHVGAISCRAIDSHEGVQFFVGQDEVYRFTVGQLPEPFAGPAEREFLFPTTEALATLAVDPIHREICLQAKSAHLSVFNYEIQGWTQLFVPDQNGTNSAIRQLIFSDDVWRPGRRIWVLPSAGATSPTTQEPTSTVDYVWPNSYPVSGRVVFPAVETEPPSDISLERVFMKHKITTTQVAGDKIKFAVSYDSGVTFPNYNEIAAAPLSTGGVTVLPPAELDQTGPRVMLMVEYTGRAGDAAFNFYGGWIVLGVRGPEVPNFDATAIGANL